MSATHMQIGEVAARTGLSLRSIRYYEEVGLVPPSARTPGGFRLYTEADVERLELIMQMKPLDFSLEAMGEVLDLIDAVDASAAPDADRGALQARLREIHTEAQERVASLRRRLAYAEGFARDLGDRLD